MPKKTSGSNCSRMSEGGCAVVPLRNRAHALAQKGVAAFMAIVMAVGLMPLPAYAQTAGELARADLMTAAFIQGASEISAQDDGQSVASTAYAIYDRGTLSFVRSLDATFSTGASLEGNPLTSISGLTFESGTVYAGFESSGAAPWNTDSVRQGTTTVRFIDPIAPSGSCGGWFQGFEALGSVEYPGNLNVGNVNSLANMFNGCTGLSKLDLSEWDVSAVTDAESMFSGCERLATLDISGWQLGAVTKRSGAGVEMGNMFSGCEALGYLDLYKFDTSKATMDSMFSYCAGLTAVRLGKDFSFYGKTVSYASIPLCGLDPETGVWYRVDGEYVDKAAGTDAGSLAADYHKLESDMSGVWKRGSYTGGGVVYAQFDSATSTLSFARGETLPSGAYEVGSSYTNDSLPRWHEERAGQIRAVKFDAAVKPTSTAYWFAGLENLETVDLRALDTSETMSMKGMFKDCANLREIQGLNLLDTRKATAMDSLFQGCTSLAELDLSGEYFKTGDTSMSNMFAGCSGLERVKLGSRFKFNGCQLPALDETSGRSGMWAPVSAYSASQLSADALALAYPGSKAELVGTWVRGNALTYVVNYFNDGALVKVDRPSVFKEYNLVDSDGYRSISGFADAYGWVESSDSVGERVASYAARSVDPGTVKNLYSAWSREITVHAGNPATENILRQYCNNGSSTPAYSASIPAVLFEGVDGWDAYGWAESADVIDVPESLLFPSRGTAVTVGYSGSSRDLYAVYVRDITFKYDANEKGRGDKIPASALPGPDTQRQFFRSGDGRPSTVFFSAVSTDLPVMAGYKCLGWSMNDSPDEEDIAKELITVDNPASANRGVEASAADDPVILYAVWSPITYTDTFYANYGDNVSRNRSRVFGTTSEDIVEFTRWGYTQTGWARTSTGNATFDVDYRSQLSTAVGAVKLYAKWVPTDYDITLDLNGGSMDATAGWELESEGSPKKRSYTVEDDVTLPTTGLSKDGHVFAGWKIAGKPDAAVNGFAKNTYAEDLTFEAMWSECVPAPQPVTGLVYMGGEQLGIAGGDGYTLEATGTPRAIIDPLKGAALAKAVGTYAVTAKLQPGYAWDDGAFGDKALVFTIGKASIAKVAVSSAAEQGKDDPEVEVWVRDGNGDLVKFAESAIDGDFTKSVSRSESGEPIVTLKGNGEGFDEDAEIKSSFEVFGTEAAAKGRLTETVVNEDGSSVAKVIDKSQGDESLEKLTTVSAPDANGVVTTVEYAGSGMAVEGDRATAGVRTATVTTTKYVGDVPVETNKAEYTAVDGGTLDLAGEAVAGAAKLVETKTSVGEDGAETATVISYEAPSGLSLTVEIDAETGAVKGSPAAKESLLNSVKKPGESKAVIADFKTVERVFADEGSGSVTAVLTKAYSGDEQTGLEVENGTVLAGATKLVEVQETVTDSGTTTVTTTYVGNPEGAPLDTGSGEVEGARLMSRLTVERGADGKATRVEDVKEAYGADNVQTSRSEAVYEAQPPRSIELDANGAVAQTEANRALVTSESSATAPVPLEGGGYRTTGTSTELDADGKPVRSEVVTTIRTGEGSGTYEIVSTAWPLDESGERAGTSTETKLTVSPDLPVEGDPGVVKTEVVSSTGETTVTEREKTEDGNGKVVAVYNADGTVRLTGDALTAVSQNGEWIWLDVRRYDAALGNMKLSEAAKAKYDSYSTSKLGAGGYESARCDAMLLKLSVLDPKTGTASSRNSGLTDLKAEFQMGFANAARTAHATHAYSSWDVKSWGDSETDERLAANSAGVISLSVNSLNEFVVAVEKQVFTVEFDSAKGTAVEAVKVADGSTTAAPAVPVRDGYVFDAWYDDSALKTKHDFKKPVTANSKLYAKWKGDLSKATVTLTAKTKSLAYNAKKRVPTISSVKLKDGTAVPKAGYKVSYLKYANKKKAAIAASKVTGVATYYVKLTPKDATSYTGTNDKASFNIVAANNPFTVKAKAKTLSVKAKSGKSFGKAANAFKITNKSKAKLTYLKSKVVKGKANVTTKADGKKITVSKAGVVKVLKGIARGTYKVTVKVAAAKKGGYKKTTKSVVLTIKAS